MMECYCEPSECDDYADVWVVTWHKAKKQHKCCECLETIKPGERYEKIFNVFDGSMTVHKTCEFCAKEYEAFRARHPDLAWMKGEQDLSCRLVWEMRNNDITQTYKNEDHQ